MVAEPVRRSRFAWPHTEPPDAPPDVDIPPHRHRSARRLWAAIVALYLVVALLTYLVVINYQYVLGRGQYRDQETARMEARTTEQIRAAICGLLDGLPAGPVLDPRRAEYGCGPGIPVEELTPEAQQQLQEFASGIPETPEPPEPGVVIKPRPSAQPTPTPPSIPAATTAPTPGLPPVQTQRDPSPADPAPAPVTSTPPPLVDLTDTTDTLCNTLGICL